MLIQIDYQDKRPIYEQVVEKMQNLIVRGILSTDEKIPSVRSLAIELSINPNTIQKAYQELEKLGYIYTVKGRGNFVASHTSWKVDRKNEYLEIMNDALRELKALGVSRDEVVASIDSLYKD